MRIFLFLIIYFHFGSLDFNYESSVILKFFEERNHFHLNIFVCSENDAASYQKINWSRGSRFLMKTCSAKVIGKLNRTEFLTLDYELGVFFDIRCASVKSYFLQKYSLADVSHQTTLLLLSDADGVRMFRNSFHILHVTLAVFSKSSVSFYQITSSPWMMGAWNDTLSTPSRIRHSAGMSLRFIFLGDKYNKNWRTMDDIITDTNLKDNLLKYSLKVHSYLQYTCGLRWVYMNPEKLNCSADNLRLYDLRDQLKEGAVDAVFAVGVDSSIPSEFIQMTIQLKTFRQQLVVSRPTSFATHRFQLSPFSRNLWLWLSLAMSLACIFLWGVKFILPSEEREFTIMESVMAVIGVISNQGLSIRSIRHPRSFFFPILLLSATSYSFYNSGMLNNLLYSSYQTFKSTQDLKNNYFIFGAENSSLNRHIFKDGGKWTALTADERLLINEVMKQNAFYNVTTGVEKMRTSNLAFFGIEPHLNAEISEYFKDTELCCLGSIPGSFFEPLHLAMLLRKKFPFKEEFQRGILLLKETGVASREDNVWNQPKAQCLGQLVFVPADFLSIFVARSIYVFGLLLSFWIFCAEIYFQRYIKKNYIRPSL